MGDCATVNQLLIAVFGIGSIQAVFFIALFILIHKRSRP